MTTIAYKDGVLAVDSAIFGSGQYFGSTKKYFRGNGWVAALCGNASALSGLKEMVAGSEPPSAGLPSLDDGGEVVFVNSEGMVYGVTRNGFFSVEAPFYAAGSGEAVALGAMAAGASAEEAVRIACKYDIKTREPVIAIKVRD